MEFPFILLGLHFRSNSSVFNFWSYFGKCWKRWAGIYTQSFKCSPTRIFIVFNIANLLLVAAIEIAGMAIAFPIGIGLALVLGVFNNYLPNPEAYNTLYLFLGVGLVTLAIVINAIAYKKVSLGSKSTKGIVLSLVAGLLM